MNQARDLARKVSRTPVGEGIKVLVVEHDRGVPSTLCHELQAGGFIVESAAIGAHQTGSGDYDAIVLDVTMPDADKWDVFQRIRRIRKTPILMLTALGELDIRLRGLSTRADDFLPKPYEPIELLARLRTLVRRSASPADDIISVGRVTIDAKAQRISLGDQPVTLSPSQYRNLEQLALVIGMLVSCKAQFENLRMTAPLVGAG